MITTLTLNTYEGVHEHDADACVYNSLLCAWQNITTPEPYQAGCSPVEGIVGVRTNVGRWGTNRWQEIEPLAHPTHEETCAYHRLTPNLWRAN